jgi:hypothetical protein
MTSRILIGQILKTFSVSCDLFHFVFERENIYPIPDAKLLSRHIFLCQIAHIKNIYLMKSD